MNSHLFWVYLIRQVTVSRFIIHQIRSLELMQRILLTLAIMSCFMFLVFYGNLEDEGQLLSKNPWMVSQV